MTTTIPRPGGVPFEDRAMKSKPYEWGYGNTPRVAQLREDLYRKEVVVNSWGDALMGLGKATFRKGVRIDMDRARLITQAHKETEGQPWPFRKARVVERFCDGMPIFIKPGELIVGDANGAPDEVRWHPENCIHWMPEAVTTGSFSEMLTEEEKRELIDDIYEYWKENCMDARIRHVLPEESLVYLTLNAQDLGAILEGWSQSRVGVFFEYDKLFREGLEARLKRVEGLLSELHRKAGEMHPADYIRKRYNYEAMLISGRAMIRYAQRHAQLAREQAQVEKDETRRKELELIAEVCDRVPAKPPRNLHEALQFYWLVETVARFMVIVGQGSGQRLDQLFWPYYEADMKSGRITRGDALELIELLFLKIQELGSPIDEPFTFTGTCGGGVFYTCDLCGTKEDGSDASNDLSCLCLEAASDLRINQPPLAVRYHGGISPDVVQRIIDCLRTGGGHPALFHEGLLEQWALMRNFSPEIAKKTSAGGCVANYIKGELMYAGGIGVPGGVWGAKMLEYALFQGDDGWGTGRLGRPLTKDPREMASTDELLDAWSEHLLFYTKMAKIGWDISQQMMLECNPDPLSSFFMDKTLERGEDIRVLHKEVWTDPNFVCLGQVNVADSLAAVEKLVFQEKKYTMEQLLTALKANWAGYEEMRQDFLNAPKYGNDDDFADEWALKVKARLDATVKKVKDAWGYPFTIDGSSAIGYQLVGFSIGATPDGRRGGEYLADGSRSPMAGADKAGPTATLNSAGKLPFVHTELFNQRFMPQFLEGDNRVLFAEYLKEWHDKNCIPHVQFNCVDSKILREAQLQPEKFPDLQVRVAGYSAFFIDLPPETQESIIRRTEQSFCC